MHEDPDYGRILSDLRLKPVRLFPSLSHIFPIQTPILDRLGEVLLADALAPLQVGDGPGKLEDAGEGAGGEADEGVLYLTRGGETLESPITIMQGIR